MWQFSYLGQHPTFGKQGDIMNRIHKLGLASLAAVSIVAAIAAGSASLFGMVQPDYMALNNPVSAEPTASVAQEPETVLTDWTYTGRYTTGKR